MIKFRKFINTDIDDCLNIYRTNSSQSFIPKTQEYEDEFCRSLLDENILSIVGVINNTIVATGNINYEENNNLALLSYGLVHPLFHKKGIGSKLLTMRISLISQTNSIPHYLFMYATDNSENFYIQKFGFEKYYEEKDEDNTNHIGLQLLLTNSIINKAKEYVQESNLCIEHDLHIPENKNKH